MSHTPTWSAQLSRRRFLQAGGLGLAALSLGSAPAALAAAPFPRGFSADQLMGWCRMMADQGPRLTGNAAHVTFTDFIVDQLERMHLTVRRDRLTFDRWTPRRWSLSIAGTPVPVAFYFPYSGSTGPKGVTAPLVYLGALGQAQGWEAAAGKIAVVDVPTAGVPSEAAFPTTGAYPSDSTPPPPLLYSPPVSDIAAAPMMSRARAAGVLGVVCVRTGVSEGMAADQYAPFTTAYQDCPALWIGPTAGERVRALALQGETATFTLDATMTRGAATETVYAVLPGTDPHETVVLNTHTDGPNVAEENGALGLLSLAKQFSQVPRGHRRRTLVFVFVTGHFQLPQFAVPVGKGVGTTQAVSRWMVAHPELWDGKGNHKKAVAALTLEHLGCREWLDDPTHTQYAATGQNEVGWCYCTTPTMKDVYLASAAGTANTRTFSCLPAPALYLGEGASFYQVGIATMSLIPAPTYLTAAPRDGALSRIDKRLMAGQVETFSRALRALETRTAAQIGSSAAV